MSPSPWRRTGLHVAVLLLGLGLEVLLFLAVHRLRLFTGEDDLVDRLVVLGITLGGVGLSAQVLHAFWEIGRVPAMALVTLAAMWAWAAGLALVAFLAFLLGFAVFFELYLPVRALAFLTERGLRRLRGRGP